jgi:S-adenosylmethionine hydrolase
MARSNSSFIKKQKAEQRQKKRQQKFQNRIAKKDKTTDSSLESMIAYVDKFGNITAEPPVDEPETTKTDEKEEE